MHCVGENVAGSRVVAYDAAILSVVSDADVVDEEKIDPCRLLRSCNLFDLAIEYGSMLAKFRREKRSMLSSYRLGLYSNLLLYFRPREKGRERERGTKRNDR